MPIGARVPTKNPNRLEVDPQPEPDQATWAKLSITVERSDGGIVDAEIIRPRSWILESGLCAGRMLPLNLPELEVSGLALVTAIDDCPPIACGEGSVVTARFITREVHVVASVDVLGADGTVETITGTTIHPVWSVDRQKWVPLAELAEGETLQGLDGLAVVLGVSLSRVTQPVYNIEVHGEHVYQVGELGLVVHNTSFNPITSVLARIGTARLPYRTAETNHVKLSGFLFTRTGYQQVVKHSQILRWAQARGWQVHHWAIPRSAGLAGSEGLHRITEAGWNLIPLPARWNRIISNGGVGFNATRLFVGSTPGIALYGGYEFGSFISDVGYWITRGEADNE